MPWVIAIMMFLTLLAAAAGIALDHAARSLSAELSGRVTVQIVEADAEIRSEQADRVIAALKHLPGVRAVVRVQDAELEAALRPWQGSELLEGDLHIPALLDVDMTSGGGAMQMTTLRNAATAKPKGCG